MEKENLAMVNCNHLMSTHPVLQKVLEWKHHKEEKFNCTQENSRDKQIIPEYLAKRLWNPYHKKLQKSINTVFLKGLDINGLNCPIKKYVKAY